MSQSFANAQTDEPAVDSDPLVTKVSSTAPTPPPDNQSRLALITVRVATSFVGLVAILVLTGWLFDVRVLKSVLPSLTTMKANTAICFGMLSVAVWLSRNHSTRRRYRISISVIACATALIAALVASEYIFQWNSGVDQLLFQDLEHQSTDYPPGRFAPGTAAGFLLISSALLTLYDRPRVSHALILGTILIALVGLIGYIYNLPTLYGAGRFTSLALHTIASFLVLCVGLMACRPEHGLTFLLIKSYSKVGVYTDLLVFAAVLGPLLVGYLVLKAQRMGSFDSEVTLALFTALLIVFSVSIVWITERERHKIEDKRLQTVNALTNSEERLRLALNSGAIGIWDFDPSSGIRQWDARCRSIFGFASNAVIDQEAILSCIHPEDRASIRQSMDGNIAPEGDGRFHSEYRIFSKTDGRLKYIYGQGQDVFEGEGENRRAVRSVGTMQDITALKQGEQHLRRLNHELEQFAYAAAHDLQEPLRNICLASQLLARDYKGSFNAEADALLQILTENPNRLQDMVKDLLVYSRSLAIEDDSVAFADSNVALSSALANLKTSIEDKQAQISCGILPFVRMRETHLVQLLQNLIGNALKYSGGRGPQIHISSLVQGGLCTFRVEDNGIGVPPQHHERVFLVFKRLHGKSLPGTGIGLALCRRIVEFYGGKIWVESDGKTGSTFLFTAPVGNRPQSA